MWNTELYGILIRIMGHVEYWNWRKNNRMFMWPLSGDIDLLQMSLCIITQGDPSSNELVKWSAGSGLSATMKQFFNLPFVFFIPTPFY